MKIVRLACGLGLMAVGLGACAQRAPEASAPSASSGVASPASPAEAEPVLAAPSPAPAPESQGLSDDSNPRKSAEDNREFSSLEAAERALNQAKADLDRLALAAPSPDLAPGGAAEKKERSTARAPKAAAAASSAPTGLCENACHAFSSLTRAASAVCRLDGDSGAHCTRAKRVLADSQLRVASCSCPAE